MSKSIAPSAGRTTSTNDPILDTEQPDLFFDITDPQTLALSRDHVSMLVGEVAQGLSRDRLADEMTALGCPTSKAMIDAWSSPARSGHNLPFYLVAPLEFACRTTQLSDWHIALRGGSARYGAEALRREMAEEMATLESKRLEFSKRINAIRKQLGQL